MRSVDADAILAKIDKEREYLIARGQLGAEHILVKYCRDFVEDAPTVEPKRPEGEWRLNPLGDYVCSKCSFVVGKIERNFCPDCGTKMRDKEDVFTRKEELTEEESEWLVDFISRENNNEN